MATKVIPVAHPEGTSGDLEGAPSFIERQFPVAKISMESFAERRSNQSQSITSLGKWWGRKPLVLARATLIGLLLPASDNPVRDREIFLKLMTMDAEGLRRRKDQSIPTKRLLEELQSLPSSIRQRYLEPADTETKTQLRRLNQAERKDLQLLVFERLPYSEKLKFSCRPEELDGPSSAAWSDINAHLGTSAASLIDLVQQLGIRRFGHVPRVGDSFCGAGSIPFEAARIGCDVYASDLNPSAALLTWAAINLVGGGEAVVDSLQRSQQRIFDEANQQLLDWKIDENEYGWRIDAMLYCTEVLDPESKWMVPLAAHWCVAPTSRVVAVLVPNQQEKRYDIEVVQNATDQQLAAARESGTIQNSYVVHEVQTSLELQPPSLDMVRAQKLPRYDDSQYLETGVRLWTKDDIVPRPHDIFHERLYCIRWTETYYEMIDSGVAIELDKKTASQRADFLDLLESGALRERTRRHYRAPTEQDLARESRVLQLLSERFEEWQKSGNVPDRSIEPGFNTSQPIRERGWTYWHQLFTPRQLLTIGLLQSLAAKSSLSTEDRVGILLSIGRCVDWNSKLCRWGTGAARESIGQTFTNQALNTMLTFAGKGFILSAGTWFMALTPEVIGTAVEVAPRDARTVSSTCDMWITDPPYADAVNYHEVTEYFLAWYGKQLGTLFPDWYSDSKRSLAVRGSSDEFRRSMMECYRRMADHMPRHGMQVVMFTHQDVPIWADLATILWAAGLQVTGAWCIQTEREAAGVREGNYVQGTVILILRKRTAKESVFLDEISHKLESEVRQQLDAMIALDDGSDPNFSDADFQLAAYAAALRVLTERPIEEIDPEKEILRERVRGSETAVESLIRNAVKIACDHLVPIGLDRELWKLLTSAERFYLKGLEIESHGETRSGAYQELGRGFGASDYTDLLASSRANETRLKTASEFARKMLSTDGFGSSLVRHALFAVHQVSRSEQTSDGLNWMKTELPDYWNSREKIIHILDFLGSLDRVGGMDHWKADAESARLLSGTVRNDHV